MLDRFIAIAFFALALCALSAALVLWLAELVTWLQTDHWRITSLLQIGYDWHLLKARWFLNARWSWTLHDVLAWIPVQVALLAIAPLSWMVGQAFARR